MDYVHKRLLKSLKSPNIAQHLQTSTQPLLFHYHNNTEASGQCLAKAEILAQSS